MWKILLSALVVVTQLVNAPVPALARDGQTTLPCGCVVRTTEIEGKLGYYGNHFGKGPNGILWMTEMYFPWEGYFIDAGGKRYILDLPIGDEGAERLKGKTVRASGVLAHRQAGPPEWTFQMPFLRYVRLKVTEEVLQERTYQGSAAEFWQTADAVYALKSKDHRSRVEHVRAMLGEGLKSGKHSVRVEGDRLVVRTTAANHARIKKFLEMMKVIPGPAR
jgi:hypothetical protein